MLLGLAATALGAVMAACAGLQVMVERDPDARFEALRTYRWDTSPLDRGTGNPWVDNALLEKRIVTAVDRELVAVGYERRESDPVDFLVDYHAALEDRVDVVETYQTHGAPLYATRRVERLQYTRGTLILDIVDPGTRRQIWRGWATDAVDRNMAPERVDREVSEAVREILASFPRAGAHDNATEGGAP